MENAESGQVNNFLEKLFLTSLGYIPQQVTEEDKKLIFALHVGIGEFWPCAFQVQGLDEIIVILEDCSYTAERVNNYLSLLKKNHTDPGALVGFKISSALCSIRRRFPAFATRGPEEMRVLNIIRAMEILYGEDIFEPHKEAITKIAQEHRIHVLVQ